MSAIVTSDENLDIEFIASSIQQVLQKVHTNKAKWGIKKKSDRLTFACPICGDSHKDPHLKRGHLFLNNLFYKCYNEGCKSTFTGLCNRHSIQLDPTKKLAIINWVDSHTNHQFNRADEDSILFNSYDKLLSIDRVQEWFNSGKGPLKSFMQVNVGSQTYNYLKNRGIDDDQMSLFYEGIKFNGKWHEPYVVFINRAGEKVLGMQERNLESGFKRKFKIWTFEELYNSVNEEELDQIEAVPYNKISCVYNIFSVNYEKVVTLFEGYIDSVLFPNSLAVVGVNTDIKFLLNSDSEIRFFFDNDIAGQKKAKEMIVLGKNVFLWEKFKEWYHSTEGGDRWSNLRWFDDNIKDANDIKIKLHLDHRQLAQFFSTSKFDQIYITVPKQKKKKYVKKQSNIHNIDWNRAINDLLTND